MMLSTTMMFIGLSGFCLSFIAYASPPRGTLNRDFIALWVGAFLASAVTHYIGW